MLVQCSQTATPEDVEALMYLYNNVYVVYSIQMAYIVDTN